MKITDFQSDLVFFDIDGVLAKYDFGNNRKIYGEDDWIKLNMKCNPYLTIGYTTFFDKFIESKSDTHILSVSYSNYEIDNKIQFIKTRYPNIKRENMHFVADSRFKATMLEQLYKDYITLNPIEATKKKVRAILIEDSVQVMYSIDSLHNQNIKCYLVSDFL